MTTYKKRTRTDFIAVHCAATPPTLDIGKYEIDRWHRAQGWLGIGYHYVIRRDGTVEEGRPVDTAGAHVANFNHNSVAICLVGGVDAANKPEDNFTPEQKQSLVDLLKTLKGMYPQAKIQGHRDFPNVKKACPSFSVADLLKDVQLD
jgi:N-acetylmuramoyl-L-alanine amidase